MKLLNTLEEHEKILVALIYKRFAGCKSTSAGGALFSPYKKLINNPSYPFSEFLATLKALEKRHILTLSLFKSKGYFDYEVFLTPHLRESLLEVFRKISAKKRSISMKRILSRKAFNKRGEI
ncbi:hypothetical protein [Helicobacter cetorum]|uniref:Uncharacterized protein n=1 Tax=Helicobacter cetorum (strain ATCC BAA-429 / MIT 00-7128) TaxID=182217 RepID=I0ELK4_HELC0|nr:hypothetical protein [Helicobacter cetorum]AFI03823.1 hypothetical protein HCW_02710 [Helicobacter cetorum MIT 00-7128]